MSELPVIRITEFRPDGDGAYPTGRCLPGEYASANCQEWAERGTIAGEPVTVYWVFDLEDDCGGEWPKEASDYPWERAPDRIEVRTE